MGKYFFFLKRGFLPKFPLTLNLNIIHKILGSSTTENISLATTISLNLTSSRSSTTAALSTAPPATAEAAQPTVPPLTVEATALPLTDPAGGAGPQKRGEPPGLEGGYEGEFARQRHGEVQRCVGGLFVAVVAGLAVCCVLAVLGLGYCVHHPVCPIRATSPFSDVSPSFQSAKLTFNSSPDQDKSERRVLNFYFMSDIGKLLFNYRYCILGLLGYYLLHMWVMGGGCYV